MNRKNQKNPWIAAILNLVLPGLGYLYTGKRIYFGTGLVICTIVISFTIGFGTNLIGGIVGLVVLTLFAYDGYKTAEEVNGKTYT